MNREIDGMLDAQGKGVEQRTTEQASCPIHEIKKKGYILL